MNLTTTLKWIAAIAIAALIVRSAVLFVYEVENSFMEPEIGANQIVMGSRWSYGLRFPWTEAQKLEILEKENRPKVNDLVAIEFKHQPGLIFIKRVVAVPGDRVKVGGGILEVNGQACTYEVSSSAVLFEKCTNGGRLVSLFKDSATYPDRLLVDGEYFVLYDSRDFEEDMSLYGIVNFPQILGKVFWKF